MANEGLVGVESGIDALVPDGPRRIRVALLASEGDKLAVVYEGARALIMVVVW